MSYIILGILLSVCIIGIIVLIGMGIYDCVSESWQEIMTVITTITLSIVSVVLIMLSTNSYGKLKYSRYIEKYQTVKTTIEESIHSDNLSGAERLQLVQRAIDENSYLTGLQFDAKQWYGFLIDENVLELAPISFD